MLILRSFKGIPTKTGSGKSLSYESVPVIVSDPVCVLIIEPLNSIMDEQKKKLEGFGFRCAVIHSGQEDIDVKAVKFIFTSPEIAVGDTKLRKQFYTTEFKETLKLIVVDEAHTVLQWGESHEGNDPFREYFSRIGELRSVFLNVPVMALTATASPLKRKRIMKSLCLNDCVTILDSPDRTNIKISTAKISNISKAQDYFTPLLDDVETQKDSYPRTLIFGTLINDCAKVYIYFLERFGRQSTLFNMYHSETKDYVKASIREDMNLENGNIRVLICTNVAGMGVNFRGVQQIIHYGLPRDMDTINII
ncbi:recQ-like DNA helicase blm-1 [Patella vulgata]|uniref:recQ-like DNA helicase blm-1 n=1 Tax=Patella vulgata TaxID=6465 RepID=UPI0024A87CB5|nr:recQ-like DNA helicase blm-1 [Patella vulgata]